MEQEAFGRMLVEHCAPTLAGIKTGSMFSCSRLPPGKLEGMVASWNNSVRAKGLRLALLKSGGERALVYVYREKQLLADLMEEGVWAFLHGCGYRARSVEGCLAWLCERLKLANAFPHEIGLFLGYPLCDVEGFVRHAGRNCVCGGCWKVYGNAEEALRRFRRFNKCRAVYKKLYNSGRSILQLAVAA